MMKWNSHRVRDLILLIAFVGMRAAAADYAEALHQLRGVVQLEVDAGRISGCSIAIVEGQRIVNVSGFGYADKKRRVPAARDTVYRAGSISKLFTALSAVQLSEAGKLSLDQPVSELVPDFQIMVPFPNPKPITIRQLLCHRSGMIRECPVGSYFDPSEPELRETIRSIADCVLVYPPETKTKYSNIGVSIVGYTVQTIAGIPFEEYARENLFRPLRMNSSSFRLNANLKARLARGYLPVANGGNGFREIEAPSFALGTLPAGNLYTTAEDLALFVRMLLAHGKRDSLQLVRPDSLAEMFTPQLTSDTNGFGIGFMVSNSRGRKIVSHTGAVYGFTSSLVIMPDEALGVVILCNDDLATGSVDRINQAAWDFLLRAKTGEEPKPERASVSSFKPFSGAYESESYWARVEPAKDGLVATISGQPVWLRPISEMEFEASGRLLNRATIQFGSDGSFKALGQTFRRVTEKKGIPKAWRDYLGSYGPLFIPLIVSERNGHLYAMTENMYDYRLTPMTETVFRMRPGLYTDEYLVFHRSEKGKVHKAVLANMPLPRRKR